MLCRDGVKPARGADKRALLDAPSRDHRPRLAAMPAARAIDSIAGESPAKNRVSDYQEGLGD